MSTSQSAAVDAAKLQTFMGKMVVDIGAATSGALVLIGESSVSTGRWRFRLVPPHAVGFAANQVMPKSIELPWL